VQCRPLLFAAVLLAPPLAGQTDTSTTTRGLTLPVAGTKVRFGVLPPEGYGRRRVERREAEVVGYRGDTMIVRVSGVGDLPIPPAWFMGVEVRSGTGSAAGRDALLGGLGGLVFGLAAGAVLSSSDWFKVSTAQAAEIAAASAAVGAVDGAVTGAGKKLAR
jgi:hypothetical protein